MCTRRGYNTEDERNAAQEVQGLATINLKQFAELMRWGVVMGVRLSLELPVPYMQGPIAFADD